MKTKKLVVLNQNRTTRLLYCIVADEKEALAFILHKTKKQHTFVYCSYWCGLLYGNR